MLLYYVEVFKPPYPAGQKIMLRVHHYSITPDQLSPNSTDLWMVEATSKSEAVAVLVHALSTGSTDKPDTKVRRVY